MLNRVIAATICCAVIARLLCFDDWRGGAGGAKEAYCAVGAGAGRDDVATDKGLLHSGRKMGQRSFGRRTSWAMGILRW